MSEVIASSPKQISAPSQRRWATTKTIKPARASFLRRRSRPPLHRAKRKPLTTGTRPKYRPPESVAQTATRLPRTMQARSDSFIQARQSRAMAIMLMPQAKGMGPTKLAMPRNTGRHKSKRPAPNMTWRPIFKVPAKMQSPIRQTAAPANPARGRNCTGDARGREASALPSQAKSGMSTWPPA